MNEDTVNRMLRSAGVGIVAGAALLIFGPPLLRAARPLLRQAIKGAIVAYTQGREALAHITETAEDAYAEATSDMMEQAMTAEGEEAVPASDAPKGGRG